MILRFGSQNWGLALLASGLTFDLRSLCLRALLHIWTLGSGPNVLLACLACASCVGNSNFTVQNHLLGVGECCRLHFGANLNHSFTTLFKLTSSFNGSFN